jgi:hypothetical protein
MAELVVAGGPVEVVLSTVPLVPPEPLELLFRLGLGPIRWARLD